MRLVKLFLHPSGVRICIELHHFAKHNIYKPRAGSTTSCFPSPFAFLLPLFLTLLLDLQDQVVSLQGRLRLHVDCLDGPAHRGVDHRLHLHG